jgi:hypothetical protein
MWLPGAAFLALLGFSTTVTLVAPHRPARSLRLYSRRLKTTDTDAVAVQKPQIGWDWSRLHVWCFPGCDPSDGSCTPPRYTAQDARHYDQFDLVLFQGQNYSKRTNGSWIANEEAESILAARTIRAAASGNASMQPKPTFPYIQFSMPQSWYEHQASFNDPVNQHMWLRDSYGVYVDVLTAAGARGLDEGGDYPYPYRRLYDWRVPATREYFLSQVLGWIIDSEELTGAFFGDCFLLCKAFCNFTCLCARVFLSSRKHTDLVHRLLPTRCMYHRRCQPHRYRLHIRNRWDSRGEWVSPSQRARWMWKLDQC